MRFSVCLFFILLGSQVFGQIQFLDCYDGVNSSTHNNQPFYAIKDVSGSNQPFGKILFTPTGSHGWNFTWAYQGINQPVIYEGDSTSLTVDIPGNGTYYFKAEKAGSVPVISEFTVFFAHLSFSVRLSDEMDCEYATINIEDLNTPNYNGIYTGPENPLYTVIWDGVSHELTQTGGYYQKISQYLLGENRSDHDLPCQITIKDGFGFTWESNIVTFHSYIPTAKFTADPMTGEAPLEVTFDNQSVNAQRFEWYLYKDTTEIPQGAMDVIDSLLERRIFTEEYLPPYTYQHPGSYNVRLIVENTNGVNHCTDTVYINKFIVVDSSLMDVPNVFTPNGDGINDIFRVKAQSLEYFHGIIINRWGRKVYEWHDPNGGWNGRINGKYANPGTYYYIITARGREIQTRKYIKKGALLLVR